MRNSEVWALAAVVGACGGDDRDGSAFNSGGTVGDGVGPGGPAPGTDGGNDDSDGRDDSGGNAGPLLDVGSPGPSGGGSCVVDPRGMDAPSDCTEHAPPDSFDPVVQWSWDGDDEHLSAITPLVANLTDDDANGTIDLCDIPDVVVVAGAAVGGPGSEVAHIYVLDGATGEAHFRIETPVVMSVTPAIADIDGDGLPEIVAVAVEGLLSTRLVAFENDGQVKWMGDSLDYYDLGFNAIALADIDNDGDVEGVVGVSTFDHEGHVLWNVPRYITIGDGAAPAIADLDGDGDQEIVHGHAAYHHDGSVYYTNNEITRGFPQIANLDDDDAPEILMTTTDGISVLEHDGTTKFSGLKPTGDVGDLLVWMKPAAVHDFDGDGSADFATGSQNHYSVYYRDASLMWTANVSDASGSAAGTAFDFLGDSVAEAMYADEHTMFVFDGANGATLMDVARGSLTGIEYPVVADVDNDRSAEIIVVSNIEQGTGKKVAPAVQVIRDREDRWIQARRIWNQHTYHVTNVREDSTIPQYEAPSWETLNTYRTNAQIEGTGICQPVPEG